MKTYRLRILTTLAIFAAMTVLSFTGCEHLQSIKPSITNNNGDLGGSIEIVFKSLDGATKSLTYTAPQKPGGARGWDQAGRWHSLSEALEIAKAALRGGLSAGDRARLLKWGTWDTDNAVGIEALLRYHQANPREIK